MLCKYLEAKMSEIIKNITAFQPVYGVLDREDNLNFFRDVLGLKVLMEEAAMVWLGGHEVKEGRFQLEESPGLRAVKGPKKHQRTILRADANEVEQLIIRNLTKISKVYKGKSGYTFEAVSPENDVFWVTSEALTDLSALTEVQTEQVEVNKAAHFKGLSDFELLEVDLNVTDQAVIKFYEEAFGTSAHEGRLELPLLTLTFTVTEGEDLIAPADEVLDLEFIVVMLDKSYDLKKFANQFTDYNGTYLDASAKTFSIEVPDHVELWFVK